MASDLKKGELTEEILRNYFLELGYFAVRGIKFQYNNFDVTDIDLWLYSRPSPLTRERTNVDIKNKKTPQALERIFWTKGLQNVLRLEQAIVATTDSRPDVREFGQANGVIVLDGNFLSRLSKGEFQTKARLTEEDLLASFEKDSLGKLGGDWSGKYQRSKSRLLNKLDFDGCNEWLSDIKYCLEYIYQNSATNSILRLLYINISFLTICIDFVIKDHSYLDHIERKQIISEGIRYGRQGKKRSQDITNAAISLIDALFMDSKNAGINLKMEIDKQFQSIKSDDLGDFFSKTPTMKMNIQSAKLAERAAFANELIMPAQLPPEVLGIIGLLCDFYSIDRKKILRS